MCKIPHLPVVAVVGKEELGPDEHDPAVEDPHKAVVDRRLVPDWNTEAAKNTAATRIRTPLLSESVCA